MLFLDTQYLRWVINTLGVGLAVALITLLLAVPAGYSLARLTGRWGKLLAIGIFLTVVIFTLTLVMQEFIYALTFITSSSQYTVSVPIAIPYNFFVDRFVAGFTVGAMK